MNLWEKPTQNENQTLNFVSPHGIHGISYVGIIDARSSIAYA